MSAISNTAMTTYRIYSILAFTLIFTFGTILEARPNGEEVRVTAKGFGNSPTDAVQSALAEAAKQLFGVAIEVDEVRKQTSIETSDNQGDSFAYADSSARDIRLETPRGIIQSYRILNVGEGLSGSGFEANVEVTGLRYQSATGGQSADRISIAVLPFGTVLKDFPVGEKLLNPEEGSRQLVQALINEFAQSRKFAVLDREFVDEILSEKNLLRSDQVALGEQIRLGQELGADFLIVGKLTDFGFEMERRRMQLTGQTSVQARGKILFEYRILDVATREIRTASTYTRTFDHPELRAIDPNLGELIVTAGMMRQTASDVSKAVLDIIFPIRVVKASSPNQIILNQGGMGMEVGTRYEVYSKGEALIDPATGENLGSEEEYLGVIEVTRVRPKFSIAQWIEGEFEWVEAGAICRNLPGGVNGSASTGPSQPVKDTGFRFPGSP